jgi:N-acetylglucosaminyldiphosphoundecaprenol N-acetyl-beta-D-mannosaminyltransferase
MAYSRYSLINSFVDKLEKKDLISIVDSAVKSNKKTIIGYHNLHSLYLFQNSEMMRLFYSKCHFIHIDGMPLIWMGKLLGHSFSASNRLTSLDWLNDLLKYSGKHQLNIFLLGGKPGVAEKAVAAFKQISPNVNFEISSGYFDHSPGSIDNQNLIEKINKFKPDILLVGMGMPLQEEWILHHEKEIHSTVIWSLGAFMDYYAGEVATPPRWMGRFGLEWAFRLMSEPNRLWKRYLIEPLLVGKLFVKQYLFIPRR